MGKSNRNTTRPDTKMTSVLGWGKRVINVRFKLQTDLKKRRFCAARRNDTVFLLFFSSWQESLIARCNFTSRFTRNYHLLTKTFTTTHNCVTLSCRPLETNSRCRTKFIPRESDGDEPCVLKVCKILCAQSMMYVSFVDKNNKEQKLFFDTVNRNEFKTVAPSLYLEFRTNQSCPCALKESMQNTPDHTSVSHPPRRFLCAQEHVNERPTLIFDLFKASAGFSHSRSDKNNLMDFGNASATQCSRPKTEGRDRVIRVLTTAFRDERRTSENDVSTICVPSTCFRGSCFFLLRSCKNHWAHGTMSCFNQWMVSTTRFARHTGWSQEKKIDIYNGREFVGGRQYRECSKNM